ncbi:MAG: TATA-box-binding protein [Candidatus Lokiarchaeota archaeon]|nr:TATA-box-binding protein [Candidatus Lokiarchaeota archaeon]
MSKQDFDIKVENEKLEERDDREDYDYEGNPLFKIVNIVGTVEVEISKEIDLTQIARTQPDVEYNPERFPGLVMRIEKPHATSLIFSNGKMVLTGLKDVLDADKVVKKILKNIRKSGLDVRNPKITPQNIVATGDLHVNIDLNIAVMILENAMYEPEVFPGLIYKMHNPNIVFNIFSTGRFVCLGAKEKETIKEGILKLKKQVHELGVVRKNLDSIDNENMSFL